MRKLHSILIILLALFFCTSLYSQGETTNWFFGNKAGLNFDGGAPNILNDGAMNTIAGCATMSKPNGDLLFYTDGQTVWNKNHVIMDNGEALAGQIENIQSSIIIPKPEDPDTYYIFTIRTVNSTTLPVIKGVAYSTVEFSNTNPLGRVVIRNRLLEGASAAEKLSAVHHEDGKSFWLITLNGDPTPDSDTMNTFNIFKIDQNGIALSSQFVTSYDIPTLGAMKISPDGTKIAVAGKTPDASKRYVYSYHFNKSSGLMFEDFPFNVSPFGGDYQPIGLEFSPNSQFLYYTYYSPGRGGTGIAQYNYLDQDINDPRTFFHFDPSVTHSALQLANDGKIYVALSYGDEDDQGSAYLGVINKPNELGLLCDYVPDGFRVSPGTSRKGLPNFVQSYFASKIITENQCVFDTFSFSAESYSQIQSINWDFGDGTTSTSMSPDHVFTTPGLYSVKADLVVGGSNITVYKQVDVFALPSLTPNQALVQCDDDSDGISTFNLNNIRELITNVDLDEELFFYESNANAIADIDRIDTPQVYVNTVPNQEVFVKVVNENGCSEITSFFLRANFVQLPPISEIYTCEDIDNTSSTPMGIFDLREKRRDIYATLGIPSTTRLAFYGSLQDAQTTTDVLDNYYLAPSSTIWVRAQEADLSCSGIQSFNIIVNPKPAININDSYTICDVPSQHPPITLSGDASNDRYEWLDSNNQVISTQQNFTLTSVGTFTHRAYKAYNGVICENIKTFTVVKPDTPVFESVNVAENGDHFNVDVNVTGNSSYEFSVNGTDFFGSGTRHTFTNVTPGLRTIYVRDLNNCEPPIQTEVSIIGFPKFFTPNNDGFNDFWKVKGVSSIFYKSIFVRVYNRYGKAVYQTSSFDEPGWNGTYDGKELIPNDYWYSVQIIDLNDNVIQRKGHLSLIRNE